MHEILPNIHLNDKSATNKLNMDNIPKHYNIMCYFQHIYTDLHRATSSNQTQGFQSLLLGGFSINNGIRKGKVDHYIIWTG